jgi:hypothetical protein
MTYGTGLRETHGTGVSLDTIVTRTRLPIRVEYSNEMSDRPHTGFSFWLWTLDAEGNYDGNSDNVHCDIADPDAATRAYFALVAQLTPAATSLDVDASPEMAGTAAGATPMAPAASLSACAL